MHTIALLTGTEEFQMTGLSAEQKADIKTQAIKRGIPASALLYAAYVEYVKRHPVS